jgi:hypothetical protein
MIDFNNDRVKGWLQTVWPEQALDVEERSLRFIEEALELGESLCVSKEQAVALVEQVYGKGRPGEPMQELGGTCVTLAALCVVAKLDADVAYEREFTRCEDPAVIARIQEKHRTKAVVSSIYKDRK